MPDPEVVVALARCSRREGTTFGIRMQQVTPGSWTATWAFSTPEGVASREGYDKTVLRGAFGFDERYPGCPGCEQSGLLLCGCGKLGCWGGSPKEQECPWCGEPISAGGPLSRLEVQGDR